jgi:transposase
LGRAHRHRLLDPAATPAASRYGIRAGSCAAQKKLARAAADERRKHPHAKIEIWATDEHRIGLKPITRGVWAPIGERPVAVGHHRFEWLYVTGFVEPATGRTVWNVSNNVSKSYFELVLADFAKSVGAGRRKRIVLQLDNAGWHGPENLTAPDGIRLVFQPAHSPELQPAEHLWALVDEPLVNRYFETIEHLDQVVGQRCVALTQQQNLIRDSTLFHWWPRLKHHTATRK